MTTSAVATESGHWYASDGTPAYETASKDGSMRPTTLRDARKLKLVPSVTTVTSIIAKPGLQNWLVNQALDAALTLPRIEGESLEQFKARAINDAGEQAAKARDNGTAIHGSMELAIQGKPYDAAHMRHVEATMAECAAQGIMLSQGEAERSFAHALGYGGKADWHSKSLNIVLDFKTKDSIDDAKKLVWPEHSIQLAAYREGFALPTARCFNVFIGVRDQRVVVIEHDEADIATGWRQFQATLALWKVMKGYDPCVP